MATILIGTSGYSYTEWVGPFYPEGTKAESYLSHYATIFPTVELNFSYYRMPQAEKLLAMHDQAPGIGYAIKAHESLTHTIDPANWRSSAQTYRTAVTALQDREALRAILFQFPYSFHYEPVRRKYLDQLLRTFEGFPLAVEFRNAQWYNNRTLDALRERQVALASLDLPDIKGSPPMMDVATSALSYVRLHGRNKECWWGSDAASRYDYLYSPQELSIIAQRIKSLATSTRLVLVYFNNHRRGQATQNALALQKLITSGSIKR
jgi:uncharacterized protein YecE (DUF72 family)